MGGSSNSLDRFLAGLLALCLVSMTGLVVLRLRLSYPISGQETDGGNNKADSHYRSVVVSAQPTANITAATPEEEKSVIDRKKIGEILASNNVLATDPPFYLFPDLAKKRPETDDERLRYRLETIGEHLNKSLGMTEEGQMWSLLRAQSPRIVYLHSVLDADEAEALIHFSRAYLERSQVNDNMIKQGGEGSKIVQARSSNGMFLSPGKGHDLPANHRLRRRVGSVVGLPVDCAESTQILHYLNGQEYKAHPDVFNALNKLTLARGGQRILTAIIWLSDVLAGGSTSFPNSRNPTTSVSPRRGDGLVFYNVMPNFVDIDNAHIHSGDPVINGTKMVAVMWFHPRAFN